MNIFKLFKRGDSIPQLDVVMPKKKPEPISDLAKNIVKLFDEDKIALQNDKNNIQPRIYSLYQSESYAILGTGLRIVRDPISIGIWRIRVGDYICNWADEQEISSAMHRYNERRIISEEKEKNKRIEALSAEIARIANQTSDNNTNAD